MSTPRIHPSEVDGHMYRDNNPAPFRKDIAKWHSKINTVAELKATIRAADRAFGGVSLVLHTDDGADLCEKCARSEFRQIAEAVRDKDDNGWRAITASMDNELEPCECAHCGTTIVEDPSDGDDESFSDPDPSDDFIDSDPWVHGPDGDMYG